jgi:hypothetical protein
MKSDDFLSLNINENDKFQFAMSFARGDLVKDIDYAGDVLKEESSFAEQAFAIFMNNLEIFLL